MKIEAAKISILKHKIKKIEWFEGWISKRTNREQQKMNKQNSRNWTQRKLNAQDESVWGKLDFQMTMLY